MHVKIQEDTKFGSSYMENLDLYSEQTLFLNRVDARRCSDR